VVIRGTMGDSSRLNISIRIFLAVNGVSPQNEGQRQGIFMFLVVLFTNPVYYYKGIKAGASAVLNTPNVLDIKTSA